MKYPGFKLILLCILVMAGSRAGAIDPRCSRSTEGTEFWFSFMEGRSSSNNHYVEITVTSRVGASFNLYIGNSAVPFNSQPLTVNANGTYQLRIPFAMVEPEGSEQVLPLGLHLVADNLVNLYALNHDNNSSDVAVIYPVESLGTAYFAMCYTPHLYRMNNTQVDPEHGRNSEFVVVASQDVTTVTILPRAEPDGLQKKDQPFTVVLNKGELYQVQSYEGDLTGSYITADKPVAVYSGSFSTTIPYETPNGGWDHLYEQMPHVKTWGREYYTVPLVGRSKDYFRVMASQPNTTFFVGNTRYTLTAAGDFSEFSLNAPSRIIADKPILIAQFSQSRSNDGVTHGDGFMVILSPVSQAKNDVTFVAYESTLMRIYYVNVVVPVSEIGHMELSGNMINSGSFRTYPNGKYAYAQLPLSQGAWRLRNTNPNRGFVAYVYGFGGNEAFGYGVGFNLDLVLDLSDGLETMPNLSYKGDSIVICQGSSLKLDAGPYFDDYAWSTGILDTLQDITVTRQGKYEITASTIDGCKQKDFIYVSVSDPKTSVGNDTLGCPHTRPLTATGDFSSYAWSTGETTKKINISKAGDYSVTASDRYGCQAFDAMKLSFYPVPEVKLDGEELVCGIQTGQLTASAAGEEGNWTLQSYKWTSEPSAGVSFPGSTAQTSGYRVPAWGKYTFIYSLTTTNQCVVKDSLLSGIYQIPTSNFSFVDNPGDPCAGYSREVLYTGNATRFAQLDWDFGGCVFDSLDWNRVRVSFAPFGTQQPFVSLKVSEDGCIGDPFSQPFGASPNFTMTTDKRQACDSDIVSFTGKLNIQDILDFEWDFGDGSTSTEQFPVHAYNDPGFYDVSLRISNPVTGCQSGFLMEEMVKIYQTPLARFTVDYPVAILGQANLTFDNLTEAGESYIWDFGEGGSSSEMNPRYTYDQVGQFPVLLTAKSGMGCIDTMQLIVDILPFNLFAPNAFRPDSPIAENQTFIPFTLGVDPDFFHLQIYNRWGEMIFESKSIQHPWDGKTRNGQHAPMGNYIWKADYTDVQGFFHSRKGQVVLVR